MLEQFLEGPYHSRHQLLGWQVREAPANPRGRGIVAKDVERSDAPNRLEAMAIYKQVWEDLMIYQLALLDQCEQAEYETDNLSVT